VSKREPWRFIGFLALLGLVVAGACYAYAGIYVPSKPSDFGLLVVSLIVCPPQLIFVACLDCDAVGWNGLILYTIIGVLNALLYAIIGLLVVTLRGRGNASKLML